MRRDKAALVNNSSTGSGSNGVLKVHHPASLNTFCDRYPSDLAVNVTWIAKPSSINQSLINIEPNVIGHHFISGLNVCPKINNEQGCPLSLELIVNSTIYHTFNPHEDDDDEDDDDTIPCVIPVKVRISNQQFLGCKGLNFILEVAQESIELKSDSSISWLGITSHTIQQLEATETIELELLASFPSPGVYEINQFAVRMNGGYSNSIGSFFTFPTQCLVTVLDKQL